MQRELVQAIHASPLQVVAVVAGGGSDALAALLREPGASRTILESIIPYSSQALARFLGGAPDEACSERTARAMAMQALLRALALVPASKPVAVAGVACTAGLATDRPKRGDHRCHIAVHTLIDCVAVSLVFEKGKRSRAEEEEVVSTILLNEIAAIAESGERLPLSLAGEETPIRRYAKARDGWRELLLGETDLVCVPRAKAAPPAVLLPGAFNPLHEGHLTMARVASEITGCTTALELAIVNADKPPLDYLELARRVDGVARAADLYLTRSATFVEKAAIFPGVLFAVGTDTIERIADPRYYGGTEAARDSAIASIRDAGCRFLVFGRKRGDRFVTLSELPLPPALEEICESVSETRFRIDISSTEIRAANIASASSPGHAR